MRIVYMHIYLSVGPNFFRKCSLTLLKIFFDLLVDLHVPYGNFRKFGKCLEISEDTCPFEIRFYELIAELMRQIWYRCNVLRLGCRQILNIYHSQHIAIRYGIL